MRLLLAAVLALALLGAWLLWRHVKLASTPTWLPPFEPGGDEAAGA